MAKKIVAAGQLSSNKEVQTTAILNEHVISTRLMTKHQ